MLSLYGVNNGGKPQSGVVCPRCGARNPGEANYCWRCGMLLRSEILLVMKRDKERLRELLVRLFKELGIEVPKELFNS